MSAADWLLVYLVAASFFALCALRSSRHFLWADEILGYRVVGASSLHATLRGWWEGADGGGLVYYLLAWVWIHLFGLSALTLRLFSAAGMAAAVLLIWATARRYFSTVAIACAIGLVYLIPLATRWQEINARFYGTFLAAAAFASLCFLWTATERLTRLSLAMVFVAHVCLIGSHILGCVYSFSLLLGMVVLDRLRGRLRWPLYLAAGAAWVLIPLSFHAIRSSTSIAKGSFWTVKPGLQDLLLGVAVYDHYLLRILLVIVAAALAVTFFSRSPRLHSFSSYSAMLPLVTLCGSLLLGQLILFSKSRIGISIYSDRYLLPVSLVTVLILSASFEQLLPAAWKGVPAFSTAVLPSLAFLLPCFAFSLAHNDYPGLYAPLNYTGSLASQIPHDAPVLVSEFPSYTMLATFEPTHRYLFLLDWPYDLRTNPGGDFSGQRLMENWHRAGYAPDDIVPFCTVEFKEKDFYVLLDGGHEQWFADRLLHNPAFQVQQLRSFPEWYALTLWSVHRRSSQPPGC